MHYEVCMSQGCSITCCAEMRLSGESLHDLRNKSSNVRASDSERWAPGVFIREASGKFAGGLSSKPLSRTMLSKSVLDS